MHGGGGPTPQSLAVAPLRRQVLGLGVTVVAGVPLPPADVGEAVGTGRRPSATGPVQGDGVETGPVAVAPPPPTGPGAGAVPPERRERPGARPPRPRRCRQPRVRSLVPPARRPGPGVVRWARVTVSAVLVHGVEVVTDGVDEGCGLAMWGRRYDGRSQDPRTPSGPSPGLPVCRSFRCPFRP